MKASLLRNTVLVCLLVGACALAGCEKPPGVVRVFAVKIKGTKAAVIIRAESFVVASTGEAGFYRDGRLIVAYHEFESVHEVDLSSVTCNFDEVFHDLKSGSYSK